MLDFGKLEPGGRDRLVQSFVRRKKATWEDIFLDEVDAAAIGLEPFVLDRDDLQHGAAILVQAALQRLEVTWPVCLAHCLEHLDRDDPVELAFRIPVILQP
ncbi:hypothetical protein D3C73_733200 [compost metagenome]